MSAAKVRVCEPAQIIPLPFVFPLTLALARAWRRLASGGAADIVEKGGDSELGKRKKGSGKKKLKGVNGRVEMTQQRQMASYSRSHAAVARQNCFAIIIISVYSKRSGGQITSAPPSLVRICLAK